MKRVVSALMSFVIVATVSACAFAESIRVTDTGITAEDIPENGTIIAVLYDSDGALTGLKTYKGTETAKYAEDMAGVLPDSEMIKVFVWDMENIKPLGKVYGDKLDALPSGEPEAEKNLQMKIGDTAVEVEWEDNESVTALREMCKTEPITIQMSKYGDFEQVGGIGKSLPTNDVNITTSPGDVILYSGNQLVVFYGSNKWAYTRLGHITDKTQSELSELLGGENVTITISMEGK